MDHGAICHEDRGVVSPYGRYKGPSFAHVRFGGDMMPVSQIMELDRWQENTNINNINVERIQSLHYIGAMFTTNGDGASNIKQRLAMAVQALNNIQ